MVLSLNYEEEQAWKKLMRVGIDLGHQYFKSPLK